MSDQPPSPPEASGPTPSPPAGASRRRRLAIRGGIAAGIVLLLFVLVVFVLPSPLARYVIESQLEDLGIAHDGVDTVEIDLWNSNVHAGPVRFHSGQSEDGQIGETGFDYSFTALFKGRAFLQTFHLRGVDLYIARLDDGAIAINGVNLQDLGGPEEKAAEEAPPPEEEEDGFGFGVERFQFADSQLIFEDIGGGSLAIELERLTLDRLLTWTPEQPTSFDLTGRLNEMQLAIDGTVTPLGDPLRLTLNSQVTGITLDRIARFVGPTGLARQEGTMSTEVHYDYVIHRDGRTEGTVDGTYDFSGFEIATEDGATVSLGDARLKVDLQQALQADGSASAQGQINLEGSPLSLSTALGDSFRIGSLALAIDDLDFNKGVEERRRLLQMDPAAAAAEETERRAPTIVELMIGWARELAEEALNHQFTVSGQPDLTLNDGQVHLAARGEVPEQDIRFDAASVELGEVASEAFDAGVRADSPLNGVISGLSWATGDGRAGAELAEVRISSEAVRFLANIGETSLAFDLALALQQLSARDREVGTLDLGSFTLTTEDYSIRKTPEDEVAQGPISVTLEELALSLAGPEGDTTVRSQTVELGLSPFTLAGKQGEAARFGGSLAVSDLAVERGGEAAFSLTLAGTRSDFQDFNVAPLSAQAAVDGSLSTTLSDLRLEAGRGAETVTLALDSLENAAEGLRADGFESDTPSATLANRTSLRGLKASLPLPEGQTVEAALQSFEAPLSELALSGGTVSAKGSLELAGITAAIPGDRPQSLDVASLSLSGLSGDSATGAAAERLALGEVVAKLALPLPGTGGPGEAGAGSGSGGAESPAEDTPETASPDTESAAPAKPIQFDRQLKLGEFSIASGSRIEITDRTVEPPLTANILLDEATIGPLDTSAPETRTDVSLALSANQNSKASLQGWAAPLKAKPDFELSSRVEGLSLPLLSPYAANAVGVNIESGALTASTDATASDADLGGNIDLRIDDLFVTPLSEEEAEKLKADIGLPVGFAVSILKDSEGVISFGLPLSGTVAEPQIDYSEAINKAVTGAMASVFPTSWFGPDGNTFEMQPAPFVPGTAELTAHGKDVADEMGELFAEKPGISIRTCGRAGRADLVALRGGDPEDPMVEPSAPAPADQTPPGETAPQSGGADGGLSPAPQKLAPTKDVAAPSDQEVEALLSLATERGMAVRKYLEASHGIDPTRLPECRTGYSIKDGKPPRAEFQF